MFLRVGLVLLSLSALIPLPVCADDARVALCNSPASARRELRYRMTPGESFDLEISTERDVQQKIPDGDASARVRSRSLMTARVKSVVYDSLALQFTYGDRFYACSGESAAVDTIDFSRLTGKTVEMMLSRSGVAASFEGFAALPELPLKRERRVMSRQDYVNDLAAIFPELPLMPVGIGDSWFYEARLYDRYMTGQLGLTCEFKYTVLADTVVAGLNCFKCAGEFTVKGRGQGIEEISRIRLDVDLSGSGTDTLLFAYDRGMMLERNPHWNVSGTAFNAPLRYVSKPSYVTRRLIRLSFK